jgi:hypothetical protein
MLLLALLNGVALVGLFVWSGTMLADAARLPFLVEMEYGYSGLADLSRALTAVHPIVLGGVGSRLGSKRTNGRRCPAPGERATPRGYKRAHNRPALPDAVCRAPPRRTVMRPVKRGFGRARFRQRGRS